ncbi:MAG: sugar transferase [Thermodesulfobacteriota bacterium]
MDVNNEVSGLTRGQWVLKSTFDFALAVFGLLAVGWLILLAWLAATVDTRANGFFMQYRVGRHGRLFRVVKIRTMKPDAGVNSSVTTCRDYRITRLGHFLRRTKIDELPQLFNVLAGQMSFVGPRPDVAGFADRLEGGNRAILSVRPGITGPATLKFCNEEQVLANADDPERYNREFIYPEKVRLNRSYVEKWSFWQDLGWLWQTVKMGVNGVDAGSFASGLPSTEIKTAENKRP